MPERKDMHGKQFTKKRTTLKFLILEELKKKFLPLLKGNILALCP
jgi:hypothetical protein